MTGTVKTIIEDRGFGFIAHDDPKQPDTFFHCKVLENLDFAPQLLERRVEFETMTDPRSGKLRARYVRPAS